MHRTLAFMSILITTCVLSGTAGAADVPKRKPGLWQLSTVGTGSGIQTSKVCVGEDDKIVTPGDGSDCSEQKASSGGTDTTIVDVVCTTEQGKETISASFTGDFNSRYRAQVKITLDPPPERSTGHIGVTIDGKYLGPDCPEESK